MPDDPVQKHQNASSKATRKGRLKAARKALRRNLNPAPPRRKSWSEQDQDVPEELDHGNLGRIMPLDERDRRRAREQAAFSAARGPEKDGTADPRTSDSGLVIATGVGSCRVEIAGRTLDCSLRGTLTAAESEFTNAVAVGDRVAVSENGDGAGVVEAVLPRRTALSRPDVFHPHRQRVVVANADQLLIVSSWREPNIWLEMIDRYVIAAMLGGLDAIICVNKIDLADDGPELHRTLQPYHDLGHPVLLTSAVAEYGIDELRDALAGRISILAGLSGTGKSSLLNAVQPGLDIRTQSISTDRGRTEGRHTTVGVAMYRLQVGGVIVDTPGVRDFGLRGVHRSELGHLFPEIAALVPGCRFSDCSHDDEPDCGVVAGLGSGKLAASRYHSYRAIRATLPP